MKRWMRTVVHAPPCSRATRPMKLVRACLGRRYCGRTARRSDTGDSQEKRGLRGADSIGWHMPRGLKTRAGRSAHRKLKRSNASDVKEQQAVELRGLLQCTTVHIEGAAAHPLISRLVGFSFLVVHGFLCVMSCVWLPSQGPHASAGAWSFCTVHIPI